MSAWRRLSGRCKASTDPDEAARNLGIDPYPGAQLVKGSSSNMNMGNMHTASAEFESSDPASSVADFYKSKLPGANVISRQAITIRSFPPTRKTC